MVAIVLKNKPRFEGHVDMVFYFLNISSLFRHFVTFLKQFSFILKFCLFTFWQNSCLVWWWKSLGLSLSCDLVSVCCVACRVRKKKKGFLFCCCFVCCVFSLSGDTRECPLVGALNGLLVFSAKKKTWLWICLLCFFFFRHKLKTAMFSCKQKSDSLYLLLYSAPKPNYSQDLNCFIQHYIPRYQLITKNCSSVSHFRHCGQILLPAVRFHTIHLLFLHYSPTIRYSTSFRKSPTLTLWKSSQIELSQQFPAFLSWQNVFIAVQDCSRESVHHPCVWQTSTRTYTHSLRRSLVRSRGPIMGYGDRERLQGSQRPPRLASNAHSAQPARTLTVIGTLWYSSGQNKGTMCCCEENVLVFSQQTLQSDQIEQCCSVLTTHSRSLLR